jgi:hypothetical protein
MPRKPKQIHYNDGRVEMRLVVPSVVYQTSVGLAERLGLQPEQALVILLDRLALLCERDPNRLGPDIDAARNHMVMSDRASFVGMPPIDITKLHRSDRTRSGFTGVYSNGQGFRAVGKDFEAGESSKRQRSIGTYPTAEGAAWARYLYYKKHNLPYGEVETELAHWRGYYPKSWTDQEIIDEVNILRESHGQDPISLADESIDTSKPRDPIPFGFEVVPATEVEAALNAK